MPLWVHPSALAITMQHIPFPRSVALETNFYSFPLQIRHALRELIVDGVLGVGLFGIPGPKGSPGNKLADKATRRSYLDICNGVSNYAGRETEVKWTFDSFWWSHSFVPQRSRPMDTTSHQPYSTPSFFLTPSWRLAALWRVSRACALFMRTGGTVFIFLQRLPAPTEHIFEITEMLAFPLRVPCSSSLINRKVAQNN